MLPHPTTPHHTIVHCNPPCHIASHPTTPQICTTSHHTCTPHIRTTSHPPHTTPYHTTAPHRKVPRRPACRERHKTGCQHVDTPVQLQVRRGWLSFLNVIQNPYPTSCCNQSSHSTVHLWIMFASFLFSRLCNVFRVPNLWGCTGTFD